MAKYLNYTLLLGAFFLYVPIYTMNLNEQLREAASRGNIQDVTMLLNAKANVNAQDDDGWTALMWASSCGHKAIVELLLKHKADINAQDKTGNTALIKAVTFRQKDIIQPLLTYKANFNIQNNAGKTALMRAIYNGDRDIATLLLNTGADVAIKDHDGYTALDNAKNNIFYTFDPKHRAIAMAFFDTLLEALIKQKKQKGIESSLERYLTQVIQQPQIAKYIIELSRQ